MNATQAKQRTTSIILTIAAVVTGLLAIASFPVNASRVADATHNCFDAAGYVENNLIEVNGVTG